MRYAKAPVVRFHDGNTDGDYDGGTTGFLGSLGTGDLQTADKAGMAEGYADFACGLER